MTPKFSIITTCMGRLDHLKQTLPRLLEQPDCEVIVVDWSCPQDTAGYVAKHFPAVNVVAGCSAATTGPGAKPTIAIVRPCKALTRRRAKRRPTYRAGL